MLLQTIGVTKTYEGNVHALRGVDIAIESGEFVSIIGASGSGKSTLLTILSGIEKPTEGQVLLSGENISQYTDAKLAKLLRTKIGFVFQFFNLAPYLTVEENILLPIFFNKYKVSDYKSKLDDLLVLLNINHTRFKVPQKLSGGEQQRVAIARSLIFQPEIVMLDEPTGNLDSKTGNELMSLLENVNSTLKTTIIQVTHNPAYTKFGRVIRIKDGLIED